MGGAGMTARFGSRRAPADVGDSGIDEGPDPRRASRRAGLLLTLTFVAIALAAVLALIPMPYAVMSPGPVTNTLGLLDGTQIIEVKDQPREASGGQLFFTTVQVHGGPGQRVTVYDLLAAKLDGTQAIYPEEEIFPKNATRQQVRDENAAEMEGSQQVAAAVAERALGKDVQTRIEVASTLDGSPAAAVLKTGDVLVSVDGKPATSPAAVRAAVRGRKAGDTIAFVVRRSGTEMPVSVTSVDRQGVPSVGVYMRVAYTLPVGISIHAGAVGGPSAGMMFALGIYDVLTPGELTGGKSIAGTGTIADDGRVGAIGGIQQKLAGAKAGGAAYFLAPADNCDEVVGHVPAGLQVVKVENFPQALGAVQAIASGTAGSLPTCTR